MLNCKKIVTSIMFLTGLLHIAQGQTHKNIQLSYSDGDFIFSKVNEKYIVDSRTLSVEYDNDTSAPALPWVGVTVLVNIDDEFQSVSISRTDAVLYQDLEMYHSPQIQLMDSTKDENPTCGIYGFSGTCYPLESVYYTGSHSMAGYKVMTFRICPFEYDSSLMRLTFYKNVSLDIQFRNATSRKEFQKDVRGVSKPISTTIRKAICEIAANGSECFATAPISGGASSGVRLTSNNTDTVSYLIVTSEELKPAFQQLADWKTLKGIKTAVITTEYIGLNYMPGATKALKIKYALKDYVENYGTEYVLLGGDTNIIPGVYASCQVGSVQRSILTDLFYSCLGTMAWDTNGNGINGEIADSIDIDQDVLLSRLPARTLEDAEILVQRTIEYERYPDIETWENKMLMCGVMIDTMLVGSDGSLMSDVQRKDDILFEQYLSQEWSGTRYRFFDTGTSHPQDSAYQVTGTHLEDLMGCGFNFIHVDTHGAPGYWVMETSDDFNSSHASQVNNGSYSLIITSACHTNCFNYTTCLSEALMRNPNSGVIGYWGATNSGWYSKFDIFGPSDRINHRFYRHLFNDNENNLARVAYKTRLENAAFELNNSFFPTRWLHMTVNTLGDPEMPIFISRPQEFENVSISYESGDFILRTNENDCRICVMGRNGDEIDYYKIYNNVTEVNVLHSPITMDYSICVTKPGFKPYIVYIKNHPYIQNEIISEDCIYVADSTQIGSNVSTILPEGPVSIEKGHIQIQNHGGVTIKNEFEVKKGAFLEIRRLY